MVISSKQAAVMAFPGFLSSTVSDPLKITKLPYSLSFRKGTRYVFADLLKETGELGVSFSTIKE